MSSVVQFPVAAERAQKIRDEFNADFKKRWQERGDCGEFTNDIWAWQEMLEQMGWTVDLHNYSIVDFSTVVNFDKKVLLNRNVKAYHAQKAMVQAIDDIFAGRQGICQYYWEEVHDDTHRHVRDGDEYKDSEYYMTVWYSMELYQREITKGNHLCVMDMTAEYKKEPIT